MFYDRRFIVARVREFSNSTFYCHRKPYNTVITLAGLYIRIAEYSTFSWICFHPAMVESAWT